MERWQLWCEWRRERRRDEDTSNALAEYAPAVVAHHFYFYLWAIQPELELGRARYGFGDGDGESEPAPPAAPAENEAGERAAPEPVFHFRFYADETRICVWWGRRRGG